MIEFDNVKKIYGDQCILNDISFEIRDGEFFVLVGLSGSGKTTILKMINRLIKSDGGDIRIEGEGIESWDLRKLRLNTGYVLQQGALFPNLTVEENISVIPKMKEWKEEDIKNRIYELMPIFGLDADNYLEKYPHQLSGGEKQRIGILRAIVANPKLLLMDEPFSALDPLIRRELQNLMKELHSKLGITIVFVTHDMREAVMLADRIGIVSEGNLIQIDTPKNILNHPKTDFVVKLFQSEDLL